jgi:hypothetical protein
MGVDKVDIYGDSQLVIQQIRVESQCMDGTLNRYREKCLETLEKMTRSNISHVNRGANVMANTLAQQASGYDVKKGRFEVKCEPGFGNIMAIQEAKGGVVWVIKAGEVDWRSELIDCINEPRVIKNRKTRCQALKYVVIDGTLYHRTLDGILLKCLS